MRVDCCPQLENRNRVTVGFRFLLVIPIALFLALRGIATAFVVFAGFLAVVFTGRWPQGMRRLVVDTGRLKVRVSAYASLLVDDYPPFAVS